MCHLCDFISVRQSSLQNTRRFLSSARHGRPFSTTRPVSDKPSKTSKPHASIPSKVITPIPVAHPLSSQSSAKARSQAQIDGDIKEVSERCHAVTSSDLAPSEKDVLAVLARCEVAAEELVCPVSRKDGKKDGSAASALLEVEKRAVRIPHRAQKLSPASQQAAERLSTLTYSLIAHPPVFITPGVLESYVRVQSILGRPETFPEAFHMYANKPTPQQGTTPVKYTTPNPNKIANAIPKPISSMALQTAIDMKKMAVAMRIVESAYTTPAFHRDKFVRTGLFPTVGLTVAPFAAYAVASQLALYQNTMDSATATNVAFAGILAYVGFTATIGMVAITTANDQMDRITWAQGLPLRVRWIREDERAAVDRIAGAWGFRESWRRGEEEGDDWEALREWAGRKGMILDRVELMEGME